MTPDANCESVSVWWYSAVAPLWAAFSAEVAEAVQSPGLYPLNETGSVTFSQRRALRIERRKSNGAIRAYVYAHRGIAQGVVGVPEAVPLACFASAIPGTLVTVFQTDGWDVGSPDSRLATWSSLVAATARAFLTDWAGGTAAFSAEAESREASGVQAVRYQSATKLQAGAIVPFLIAARSGGSIASGKVTSRPGVEPEAAALQVVTANDAALARVAAAVEALAAADTDLAINNGAYIYSVRSKEVTEP